MAAPNLTRDQAQQRAALLEVDSYRIELELTDGGGKPGSETFRSRSTVAFRSLTAGASTGREALAMLRDGPPPDVILLDLMMPDMNGWQFREAQQRDARIRDIPLVVITASRDLVNHPIDADAVLLKPFGLNDLLGQVFKLVGRA